MGDVRATLRDDTPWSLLQLVSTLLTALDSRQLDPFTPHDDAGAGASLEELVESFFAVALPETTALLVAIAEMTGNELLGRRVQREAQRRGDRLPEWLRPLGPPVVTRAIEITHILGDGDNVLLAMRTPSGHDFTVNVYVDHNLGTVAKDGFVLPTLIDDAVRVFRKAAADEPDLRYDEIDLGDARARITEAIDAGARTYPPYETETWPASRAWVEWVVAQLPPGGKGYERPEWSEAERDALAERFFKSEFGRGLTDDEQDLFGAILWFACDYGPGDPLRWSPVAVELLLMDWLPRKIVAQADYLSPAPDVLRRFVKFSHAERGIRPALTQETLGAVDEYQAEYQRLIRSPRPQGPAAILAAMGVPDGADGGLLGPFDEPLGSHREFMLDTLREALGGQQALDELDDAPLPNEPLRLDRVAADVAERVDEISALIDGACEQFLGAEARTACRRLLTDVAEADPQVFRRKARPESRAAAVAWVVAHANELFGSYTGGLTVGELMKHFGVSGSVSDRAATMLRPLGVDLQRQYGAVRLGTPRYLVSAQRRRLLERRRQFEQYDF